jgi:hypothetical protein
MLKLACRFLDIFVTLAGILIFNGAVFLIRLFLDFGGNDVC